MEVEWDDDGMRWIEGTRLLAFTKQPSPHTANMLASITFMVNSAVLHSNWRSQCIILMLATRIPGIDNKMGMIQNQKYFVRQVVRRNKNIPLICTFKDLLGTVPLAELGSLVPVNDWFIYSGCHCPKAIDCTMSVFLWREKFGQWQKTVAAVVQKKCHRPARVRNGLMKQVKNEKRVQVKNPAERAEPR